jgi:hypothetical protein
MPAQGNALGKNGKKRPGKKIEIASPEGAF